MEAHVSAFLASLNVDPAYSESTRLAYASDLRVFLEYLQASLNRSPELGDLNANQVASFLQAESRAGRRQSTLVRRRASLRRFTAFLNQAGILNGNILATEGDLINQAISSVSAERTPQGLTDNQIHQLWSIIEMSPRPRARRDQAILALLLETGLSVGALIALDLSDLDLRTGRVHIRLDDGQDIWLTVGSATPFLERYIQEGRPDLNHQPDEPALFISQMNGRMSRQGIWQILRHWGSKVNPPITLSPRLVRHTAALRMVEAGRSMVEIQALLGHSNPLSTQALMRRLHSASRAAG